MTLADVTIRDATPEDIVRVQEFLRPFAKKRLILPRTREELLTLMKHGFIAESEGEVVGFAALEIYSRKMAEIQSLAVRENFQRQGIGRRLVEQCVVRGKSQNVLELMAITAADELFLGCGFHYSLPNQKRALFMQTREAEDHEEGS